jgi:hypothetical protein
LTSEHDPSQSNAAKIQAFDYVPVRRDHISFNIVQENVCTPTHAENSMMTKLKTAYAFIPARRRFIMILASAAAASVFLLTSPAAFAQGSRSKDKEKEKDKDTVNSQQLEIRMTKAEEGLLKEYMEVAREYLKKGEKEQALTVLKRVEHINSKMEGLKQEMDRIGEELMQENEAKLELDVSKGWGNPICEVTEGKAFRLAAVGEYKMNFSTTIPLTGLPTKDPAVDHVSVGPFGALIGVIVTDGKPGEPFVVNGGLEHTPKKSGQLYLRVNVPAAAKCTGDVKLQLSGAITSVTKKR